MSRESVRMKSRLKSRVFWSRTNAQNQNMKGNKSKKAQETKINNEFERHCSYSPARITPYVGQYWPLCSVPADQSKSNKQKVVVVTLGKPERSSKNIFEEDCSCGVEHSLYCPQRYPLFFPVEQKLSNLSLRTTKTKETDCKPDEENARSNPFNSSAKYCLERRRKHFRSSTEIPLTNEELSALEMDINNPINILEIIDQNKVS